VRLRTSWWWFRRSTTHRWLFLNFSLIPTHGWTSRLLWLKLIILILILIFGYSHRSVIFFDSIKVWTNILFHYLVSDILIILPVEINGIIWFLNLFSAKVCLGRICILPSKFLRIWSLIYMRLAWSYKYLLKVFWQHLIILVYNLTMIMIIRWSRSRMIGVGVTSFTHVRRWCISATIVTHAAAWTNITISLIYSSSMSLRFSRCSNFVLSRYLVIIVTDLMILFIQFRIPRWFLFYWIH